MKNFSSQLSSSLVPFLNKPIIDRYEWAFIIILTVLLTILLHANALSGYWRFDDGFQLMFAAEYSPWQYFFDPAITRAQSGSNVTPWSVLFYDVNLAIFGFQASGFYFHILLLIVATTLAIYALLRLWLPLPSAVLGIILFLTGKPTYHISQELMTNHYLTGLLFSLLSLIFFVNYIRYGNGLKLLSAILFYALAMTCKEVYVPLIILLFVIPAGNFKQRLRAILPFVLVAIGYALWRHQVLNAWVGGYKPNSGKVDYLIEIKQLANIPFMLFDDHGWGLAGLIIVIIMSLIAAWNRILNIPLIIVAVFILFTPLIPLTLFPGISEPDRYLFAPWTAICILVAIIFQTPKKNKQIEWFWQQKFIVKSLSALVLIIATSIGYISEKQNLKDSIHKTEDIYHFAIETDFSQKALILDTNRAGEYWAFVSSRARYAYDISKNITPEPTLIIVNNLNGLLLLDEITQNRQLDLSAIQFYRYHNGIFSPENIKTIINSELKSLKAGQDQVLQVAINYKHGTLSWEFQPKNLSYSSILWQGKPSLQYSIFQLPEKGSYKWDKNNEVQISISFKSPDGWIGVSPKFKFDPIQQHIKWQGKTDLSLITSKLESLLFRIYALN